MSGVLATLGAGASVVSALETLAFGAAGPVVLGEFAFQDFEVPETIVLPVRQAVAVHRLIGGDRVVDAMGPDPGDIGWSGIMLGAFAETRVQTLKALVDAGQPVLLTWNSWAFTVLPRRLLVRQGYQRIGYALSCVLIRDDSAAQPAAAADLGASLTADIGAAVAAGGPALSGTLEATRTTLQGLAPILPGSGNVAAALTAVAGAQGIANNVAGTSATLLAGIGARAAAPVASMGDLGAAAAQTGLLAQAVAAASRLGRMAANLTANL